MTRYRTESTESLTTIDRNGYKDWMQSFLAMYLLDKQVTSPAIPCISINLQHYMMQQQEIKVSKGISFEKLRGIKEIHSQYNDDLPPNIDLTRMSSLQKLMVKIVDLKRKYIP